jgi:hypothetical protein
MSNKKRAYPIREGHEIHVGEGKDIDGYKIIKVYHNGKMRKQETKPDDKVKYISAGNKILLTHDELINKKYWRDVIITNRVEHEDMQKMLDKAYVDGREKLLKGKAYQLGLKEADEIVEKYIGGDVVLQH